MRRLAGCIATLCLVLGGCSGGPPTGPNGEVILTLLTHYGSDPLKSGLQKLVDRWNASHPDVQVRTQAVAFEDLQATVTVRQVGGRGADIMNLYALWGGQAADANVLASPPPEVVADIRDNYAPAAVRAVSLGDRLLGYPTEVQTYTLFYNKKLFKQAGIDGPPKTWDELKADAEKLAKHDSSGNTQVNGIALLQGGDNESVHPFLSLLNAADGSFLSDSGEVGFNSDAGREVLELESDLVESGASDPGLSGLQSFPADRAGMAIQAGWWIGSLKASMGEAYQNVGTAPIPGPTVGSQGSLAYGFFMGVNTRSRHQQEAWEFVQWLNSHTESDGVTGMGKFLNDQGMIPGRLADQRLLDVTKQDPNLAPVLAALKYAAPEAVVPQAWAAKSSLHQNIMSVLTGQKDPDGALADAEAEANAALQE